MQPHMQLDSLLSLFLRKPKYSPSHKGRRLKNQASENALRVSFDHPEVPPKEDFGYI